MDINMTLLGQTIAMIVFVWFCMKFLWPPLLKAMDERRERIAEGLAASDRAEKELEAAKVKVSVYNTLGQIVAELVDMDQEAGYHTATWDASNVASGVYFYRIEANDFTATKRMILMK